MTTPDDHNQDHGGRRPGAGRPKASKATPADDRTALLRARTAKETQLAELRRLDVHERTSELIPAEAVATAWAAHVATARSKLLGIPTQVTQHVAAGDRPRVLDVVTRIVHEALAELAGDGVPVPHDAEPEPAPKRKPRVRHAPGNGAM